MKAEMRLLVISDTHKHIDRVIELLEGDHRFDGMVHLGDNVEDAMDLQHIFDLPVFYVAGNCDWGSHHAPYEKVIELLGKRLYICHGHLAHVKRNDHVLRKLIRKEGYDVVLFGHTHEAYIGYEGESVIMNPGSISIPRDGLPSFGVITIDDRGEIHTNIARLES